MRAKTMNPYLQTLHDQIGGMAFFMMGTSHLTFNNAKNELRWRIANSTIHHVSVCYEQGDDLYCVSFFTKSRTTLSEIVIEQVDASELLATIERITGLRLSLSHVYAW